jgi:multidrug resistance efflux pump
MKKNHAAVPQLQKNIKLAIGLAVIALAVGVSVFWWRLSHKMPPMPQGSVYGTAYLPVPLQQGVVQAVPQTQDKTSE